MADEKLKFTITAVDKTAQAFNKIKNRINSVSKAAAVGVGAVGGVGVAFGAIVKKTVDFADEIAKTADKVGLSTSALQELRIATDLAGIGQEQLDTALGAMSKRLGELRQGTGALNTFLNKTDKAFANQLKGTTDNEEAFRLLISRIQSFKSAQDRAALSAAAFSRSAGIALSKLTLKEIDEGIKRARELGLVIDEKLLRNAEKIKDDFELAAKVVKITFAKEILEALKDVDLSSLASTLVQAAGAALKLFINLAKIIGLIDEAKSKQLKKLNEELTEAEIRLKALQKEGFSFAKMGVPHLSVSQKIEVEKKNIEKLEESIKSLTTTTERITVKAKRLSPFDKATLDRMKDTFAHFPDEGFDALNIMRHKIEETITPLKTLQQQAKDTFGQLQDVGVNAVNSLENALVGVVTGASSAKDAFKSMAASIVSDLIRMQIRQGITAPLSGFLNSVIEGFANGGAVSANKPILVGERGAELFVPNVSGSIVPNHKMGGGNVVVNVVNNTTAMARTEERQTSNGRTIDVIIDEIVSQKLSGAGTQSNQALRNNFGARPLLAGR